jgi:hypothetical protein
VEHLGQLAKFAKLYQKICTLACKNFFDRKITFGNFFPQAYIMWKPELAKNKELNVKYGHRIYMRRWSDLIFRESPLPAVWKPLQEP